MYIQVYSSVHMYYFPCEIFRKGQTDSFKAGLCVIMEPLLIPTGHPRFARNASAVTSSSLYTMNDGDDAIHDGDHVGDRN